MLTNHIYNLMQQTVTESKSLSRIKQRYLSDSKECASCKAFWEKMITEKESTLKELTSMLKKCWEK